MIFGAFCIHCVFFQFPCDLCQRETGRPDVRLVSRGWTSTSVEYMEAGQ